MRRRRRRSAEIPFSFDSFLDVVANVAGIIIRLILVVWVGARSYSSMQHMMSQPSQSTSLEIADGKKLEDPVQDELARHRQELADAQARLIAQLRQLQEATDKRGQIQSALKQLSGHREGLDRQRQALEQQGGLGNSANSRVSLSMAELQDRQKKLMDEIRALEKMPAPQHVLRYQTPVSKPVQSEEFMFECREGRVTFIDLAVLEGEIRRDIEEKGHLLRTRWQVSDVTAPVGAFRLRYTVERARGLADAIVTGSGPDTNGPYSYGVRKWELEPITPFRGETWQQALARDSEFRRIVDRLDPQQAVVTFWVYPDSFALYRRLRDFLYERDLVVAGRALPTEVSIMGARDGSLSLGQ
jgi:hypothetical protein